MNATVTLEAIEVSSNETRSSTTTGSFFDLEYYIWLFVLPIVLLVGIVGNTLSIIVLQCKSFRHTTTGVYLPLTAVADIVVLLNGFLEVFDVTDVFSVREYSVWTCRIYKVVFYTAGDVSIWLLVAFTFDRFVAVCFPLSKRRVCTWRRAAIASTTILVLSLAKNLHEFWTRGPEYRDNGELRRICGSQEKYSFFLSYIRPWIAFAMITAVPFTLILLFNCLIVHSLIKAQRVRSQAAAVPSSTATTGTGNKPASAANSSFRQTTFMCLSISFAFLICIAPSIVLLIGKPYWKPKHGVNVAYHNAKAISNFLVFVNHSINFFLYCVTGRRFRDLLKATLTCRRGEISQTPITTQSGVSTGAAAPQPATKATDSNGVQSDGRLNHSQSPEDVELPED